jgi:hypothetical protein
MVIEITKRYNIGGHTLDSIVHDYTDLYSNNDDCMDFSEFLMDEIESYPADEILLNSSKYELECIQEICEKSLDIQNKKALLSQI